MHCVYLSFSSKNSISSAASPSYSVISNYSLAAFISSCVLLFFLHRQCQAGQQHVCIEEQGQQFVFKPLTPHMNFPHIFCLSLTFMYLTGKWLFEERSAIHWRRFLNRNNKRGRVKRASQIFHWESWPKVWNHENLIPAPPPLVGSLNFIAESYCSVMCLHAVWEAASDWQLLKGP